MLNTADLADDLINDERNEFFPLIFECELFFEQLRK